MRKNTSRLIMAALALLLTQLRITRADSLVTPEWDSPDKAIALMSHSPEPLMAETLVSTSSMQDLESRIASMEADLQALRQPRLAPSFISPPDYHQDKLFGSVEFTFLRPRMSGAMGALNSANGGQLIDHHFESGMRYTLGYRTASGLGLRGRYWSYSHGFTYDPPFSNSTLYVGAHAADLEIISLQRFRQWNLEFSSGVRHAKLRYDSPVIGAFGIGQASFEGVGPTVSVEATRGVGTRGIDIFANVRGSLLFGQINNASMLTYIPTGPIRDEVMQIVENQLGVSWTRTIGHSSVLQLRTAWETQYWMNNTFSDDALGIGTNIGFMGPTIAAELRY
ncbi:MAG: hypothetical protein KDA91_10520 [Planctomycetaceae bacterium]|nr:hypothetical protein [Planctomycetaceae bacterium]